MSDLLFNDYATEFMELIAATKCPGCLADEPDQHAHMGLDGCLADDEDNADTAPPEPLSDEQLAAIQNLAVPEGVQFYINGHLVPPGTAVADALSAFDDDYDDYYTEEECHGCRVDSDTRADHTGIGGCLYDPREWWDRC
jgi:hypothetical protein